MNTTMRRVAAIPIPGIKPSVVGKKKPEFRWVDPKTLFIEDAYQRNLSERSITLIRHICASWSWSKMKPLICSEDDKGKLFVIDGQHTAISAASHGGIGKIPVMIVEGLDMQARAAAFIGHNKDRVAMTPTQLYFAALSSGDEIAVAVEQACKKAGVTIRKSQPANGIWKKGETIAVNSIGGVVSKKGVAGGVRVLKILIEAERAPLTALEIRAVAGLCFDKEWKDHYDAFDLATLIRSKSSGEWISVAESSVRKGFKIPLWRAVAIAWFRRVPKRKGGGS